MLNQFVVYGDTTVIYLQRIHGEVVECLIDTSDLPKCQELSGRWYPYNIQTKTVCQGEVCVQGKIVIRKLHRFLLGLSGPFPIVQHVNGNGLDNRRSNLIIWDDYAKFDSRIEKSASGCWNWTGGLRNGYGSTMWRGTTKSAHRVSYERYVGPIPEGLVLDHLCRNTRCVKPAHLEVVTSYENWIRGQAPTAITYRTGMCKRGHIMDEQNTYFHEKSGIRICKTCKYASARRRYAEAKKRRRDENV